MRIGISFGKGARFLGGLKKLVPTPNAMLVRVSEFVDAEWKAPVASGGRFSAADQLRVAAGSFAPPVLYNASSSMELDVNVVMVGDVDVTDAVGFEDGEPPLVFCKVKCQVLLEVANWYFDREDDGTLENFTFETADVEATLYASCSVTVDEGMTPISIGVDSIEVDVIELPSDNWGPSRSAPPEASTGPVAQPCSGILGR